MQEPAPAHRITPQRRTWITLIICTAFFMEMLDATALNTSLPQMARSLSVSPLHMKIALISYLISVGLTLPLSAYIADRYGTQKTFMMANLIFFIGSMGCGLTHTLSTLILFRVIQGIGGAFLTPVARMIMVGIYPKNQIMRGQSLAATVASSGLMLGPLLGGWLTTFYDWHAIFFINLPVCVLSILASTRLIPNLQKAGHTTFDVTGFALLAIGLASLLFALDTAYNPVFNPGTEYILASIGVLGLAGYSLHARRCARPLFHPSLWQQKKSMLWLLTSLNLRIGMNALPFLIPLLLQTAYGFSAWRSSVLLISAALGFGLSKPVLPRLTKNLSKKNVFTACIIINAVSIVLMASNSQQRDVPFLVLWIFIFGATQGILVTLCNTTIYQATPRTLSSEMVTVNSSIIQLSTCFAVTLAAMVLSVSGIHPMAMLQHTNPHRFRYAFWVMAALVLLPLMWATKLNDTPPKKA